MTERRSNIEFVTDLMTFSAHGALVQVFVLQLWRSTHSAWRPASRRHWRRPW